MGSACVITRDDLPGLVSLLQQEGFQVIAPTLRHGAIAYAAIDSFDDLPAGWTMEQEPGRARLARRSDQMVFGHAVGAQSWKRWLLPPVDTLFTVSRENGQTRIQPLAEPPPKLALFGVRPCDLHAIAALDRVLLGDAVQDAAYAAVRANSVVIAVNCGTPADTCFCTSMETGPGVPVPSALKFDLLLTELTEGEHRFLVRVGSDRGHALLAGVRTVPANEEDEAAARVLIRTAQKSMLRRVEARTASIVLLGDAVESRHWQTIGSRCLACTNCTMVCPTCFCTTVEDGSSVDGTAAWRKRLWDSCFTQSFSYIHGGSVRATIPARYRQWMMHKLASYRKQFNVHGCTGCGRCIAWCPVGIDITEEARILVAESARAEEVR
jgi:sulfhydrogenase subunit beta (sulfur reductase)